MLSIGPKTRWNPSVYNTFDVFQFAAAWWFFELEMDSLDFTIMDDQVALLLTYIAIPHFLFVNLHFALLIMCVCTLLQLSFLWHFLNGLFNNNIEVCFIFWKLQITFKIIEVLHYVIDVVVIFEAFDFLL